MKKLITFGIIILFVGTGVIPSLGGTIVEKTTIMDSKSGSYIQDLIDNANNGDTINIPSGTYYENIVINKSIDLVGEGKETTIIDGSDSGNVVLISADWVNISGFTIQNCGEYWSGIYINSNYTTITDNTIPNNFFGIWLFFSSSNIVTGNTISHNGYGITLYYQSKYNTIANNNISNNGIGIWVLCDNNIITSNTITGNLWLGIQIEVSSNSTITGNNISENGNGYYFGAGLRLYHSSYNTITGNTISNSEYYGISISDFVSYNTITGNTISDNKLAGIFSYGERSNNNIIYHNNFINNEENAKDGCDNTWDDGYPSGGNYWDDYTGEDNNGDGIGDTPYSIPGGYNVDRYPLMFPVGDFPPDAPTINGPTSGKTGTSYTFIFNSTDPDGDDILEYIVDWGDETGEETIMGPFASGEEVTRSHTWTSQDTFTIKAKAKDVYGAESSWSEFEIEIPRTKTTVYSLFHWFLERFPLLEKLLTLIRAI